MSNISSDNLHHFTRSFETLESILIHGFYPHITEEDVSFILKNFQNPKIGYPIVCFCDLPSSLLNDHTKLYGNYGVSLSKHWGIIKGINPVMYVTDKDAQIMEYYRKLQEVIINQKFINFIARNNNQYGKEAENIMKDFFYTVLSMSAYMKVYEDKKSKKRFYDEREWRYLYIDKSLELIYQIYFSDEKNFDMNERNEILKKSPLLFEINDLQNIFLSSEEEKIQLIDSLVKCKKYKNEKDRLNRIITIIGKN